MCGIIGIASNDGVAREIYGGLVFLQHRGKESAGIVTYDGEGYHHVREMGTVREVFDDSALDRLTGDRGIGHVRYSTTGESRADNIQPVRGTFRGKEFWLAHNGNLCGYGDRRSALAAEGYRFETTTDTEFIAALVSRSDEKRFDYALRGALASVRGTYAITALCERMLIGARDPAGNRPLIVGRGRGMTVLASESPVCDVLGVRVVRDIAPGEMVVIDPDANDWYSLHQPAAAEKFCIFEWVYFFRPDAKFGGKRAAVVREEMGRRLFAEHPADHGIADVVVPVQDSGTAAAGGYAEASGLPLKPMALFRSHEITRTFIDSAEKDRAHENRFKFNPIPEFVEGKRLVVVDDSIVRANVMKTIINLLRNARAKEIHVRISSPPYLYPCYYGIDTYRVAHELVAERHKGDVEAIRQEIDADSLAYLSIEGLRRSVGGDEKGAGFCDACFTKDYFTPVDK